VERSDFRVAAAGPGGGGRDRHDQAVHEIGRARGLRARDPTSPSHSRPVRFKWTDSVAPRGRCMPNHQIDRTASPEEHRKGTTELILQQPGYLAPAPVRNIIFKLRRFAAYAMHQLCQRRAGAPRCDRAIPLRPREPVPGTGCVVERHPRSILCRGFRCRVQEVRHDSQAATWADGPSHQP